MAIEIAKDVVSIFALVASGIAVAFSYFSFRQTKFRTEDDYIKNLLDWHYDVVMVLIKLRHGVDSVSEIDKIADLAKLSSLIECGRFFFPNIDKGDGYGKDKPTAFQGYRNLALDFLVASYNILKGETSHNEKKRKLSMMQRNFTSIIFEIVIPENRLKQLKKLTGRYFVKDKIFEDYINSENESIIHHIWSRH